MHNFKSCCSIFHSIDDTVYYNRNLFSLHQRIPFFFLNIVLSPVTFNCLIPTLQRQNAENLKQIFPEKEYRGLSPNFHIHVSVSELYIPTMGLPVLLEEICRLILAKKIYRLKEDQAFSLSLELGRREKFARHPLADFLLHSVGGGGDFVDTVIAF